MDDSTQTKIRRGRPSKGRNSRKIPVTVYLSERELEVVRALREAMNSCVSVSSIVAGGFRRDFAGLARDLAEGKIDSDLLFHVLDVADEEDAAMTA